MFWNMVFSSIRSPLATFYSKSLTEEYIALACLKTVVCKHFSCIHANPEDYLKYLCSLDKLFIQATQVS